MVEMDQMHGVRFESDDAHRNHSAEENHEGGENLGDDTNDHPGKGTEELTYEHNIELAGMNVDVTTYPETGNEVSFCIRNMDEITMAVISLVDHVTDFLVLKSWFEDEDVSMVICVLSAMSLASTTIVPVFLYKEIYIKISMFFFCGMLALIYRVQNDANLARNLAEIREKRKIFVKVLNLLRRARKNVQKFQKDEADELCNALEEMKILLQQQNSSIMGFVRDQIKSKIEEMGENSNQQRSVLEELIKFTEAIQMENTSKLLLFNAPKLYKVAESTFESLPQLLLQLYVLITTSRNISTSNYFLLISSVTLSFISHAYAGTKLLYPNGYAQAIVGFLFTVSDTALRSLGLLYVFVTVDFGQKRLLICFLYIGSSCLFFLLLIAKFGTVPSEMQRGEYSFFISCLYTFIFFFSGMSKKNVSSLNYIY